MVAVAGVVILLVAHNLVGNLVLPPGLYVPVNLGVAVVLLTIATLSGVSAEDLGLGRAGVARGLAVGVAAFLVITTVLVMAALIPTTRRLFADGRVAGVAGWAVAYHALVRIPLGTVVLEEVAFRGVLLGLFNRVTSAGAAVLWSSTVFGLWHIVPAIEALRANRVAPGVLPVAAAVVATAGAGVVFCWLRLQSGSLLAPALAHLATNSVALVIAVGVSRGGLLGAAGAAAGR